jgi:hypothetical protein
MSDPDLSKLDALLRRDDRRPAVDFCQKLLQANRPPGNTVLRRLADRLTAFARQECEAGRWEDACLLLPALIDLPTNDDVVVPLLQRIATDSTDGIGRCDAIVGLLDRKQPVELGLLRRIFAPRELRYNAVLALKSRNHLDRVPSAWLRRRMLGEGALTAWLAHPGEAGHPPDEMEYMAAVVLRRGSVVEESWGTHLVYRFRGFPPTVIAPPGVWLAGIVGPYRDPNAILPDGPLDHTYCAFTPYDDADPTTHVHRVVEMMARDR